MTITGAAARAALGFAQAGELAPGVEVAPGVRLTARAGRGAMGEVWRATHERLGIEVVVKTLASERLDAPGFVERFQAEARALAKVRSANVVRVLDHGFTEDGLPFLVAERLVGEDLAARIARGPVDLGEVVRIVRDVARGLAAAHREGIFHRDVKPSNIFLTEEDGVSVAKLIDFGVAKTPTTIEGAGTASTDVVLGTPHYMSPEQLRSPKRVDARADLWSLSVVAYEALTGRLPFEAETVGGLAVAQDRGTFMRPSAVRRELAQLDAWFARAFDRSPDARFADAGELASALASAATRPARRGPLPYVLGGAALCAATVVGVPALGSRAAAHTLARWSVPVVPTLAATPTSSVVAAPDPTASAHAAPVVGERTRVLAAPSATIAAETPTPPVTAPEPASSKTRKDRGF